MTQGGSIRIDTKELDRTWVFPKIRDTPKWMVKIMETPIKMDDLGYNYFWKHPFLETPILGINSLPLKNGCLASPFGFAAYFQERTVRFFVVGQVLGAKHVCLENIQRCKSRFIHTCHANVKVYRDIK